MIKEIKYILYILIIFIFLIFVFRYYFSDKYEKKYFSKISLFENNISINLKNLPILFNDTNNVAVDKTPLLEKKIDKNRNYWNLIK
tara:strand:- start:214 stop:471 length:258 start_codon:yes stop_codon:yes gene_type:complete